MSTNAELTQYVLRSSSPAPAIFDGTTRLYISLVCPYAQRVWIARNYKGLEAEIKVVPIDIKDKPQWYMEKVYQPGRVPCLEHNGKVMGESLDLLYYLDDHFTGPQLLPEEEEKVRFAKEMMGYASTFIKSGYTGLKGDALKDFGSALDALEAGLAKYGDGPFFLGEKLSMVDIAYAPFIQRFDILYPIFTKYDIFQGRPLLASLYQELNKTEAFKKTKADPQTLVTYYRQHFLGEK
ncbi:protein IN2-1 homolog B-like [Nymphaea colorata]|nr:protein IN2-1 homolog B-like [Nymphaea colorata]